MTVHFVNAETGEVIATDERQTPLISAEVDTRVRPLSRGVKIALITCAVLFGVSFSFYATMMGLALR